MATYDQVMTALRNADAAGNVDDAKKLAQIAASMKQEVPAQAPAQSAQPAEDPYAPGYVRGAVNQGLQGFTAGLADEAYGGVGAAIDKISGDQRPLSALYDENLNMFRKQGKSFEKTNPYSSTGANIVGAVGSTAALPLGEAAQGASLLKTALTSGKIGAIYGGVSGFNSGEDGLVNRLKSGGAGAAVGGALGAAAPVAATGLAAVGRKAGRALGSALAGPVSPERAALAQRAAELNVPVLPAQIADSPLIQAIDSTLKYVPFSGRATMDKAQREAFNRSVANTFGEDAPTITQGVMARAKARIGAQFDDVTKNAVINADDDLVNGLSSIVSEAGQVLSPDESKLISKQIGNVLLKAKQNDGAIPGKTFQALIARGSPLDRLTKHADSNVQFYASKVKETMADALERSLDPETAQKYAAARLQYKNLKTVEPLAVKAMDGNISPALLLGAVKKSYPQFAYRDAGDIGDLARIGQSFIKEKIANSGTPIRTAVQNGLGFGVAGLGGAMMGVPATVGTLASGAVIGRGVNKLINSPTYRDMLINRSLNNGAGLLSNDFLPGPLVQGLLPYGVPPVTAALLKAQNKP